jgi:hypothetical protein
MRSLAAIRCYEVFACARVAVPYCPTSTSDHWWTDLWTIFGTALGNAFIRAPIPGFDGLGTAPPPAP